MVAPTSIPQKLIPLVKRALHFAASQLSHSTVFYPFAATSEKNHFNCVMTDHHPNAVHPSDMIELLQWKLIDIATERPIQTALVYAATLNNEHNEVTDAVAIELSDEFDNHHFFVFTYQNKNGQVRFSQPLTENPN